MSTASRCCSSRQSVGGVATRCGAPETQTPRLLRMNTRMCISLSRPAVCVCARYASSDKWAVTGEYDLIRRSTRASAVALWPESPKLSAPILALARRQPRPRLAATQPAALGWRMQQPGVVAHAIARAAGVTGEAKHGFPNSVRRLMFSYCTTTTTLRVHGALRRALLLGAASGSQFGPGLVDGVLLSVETTLAWRGALPSGFASGRGQLVGEWRRWRRRYYFARPSRSQTPSSAQLLRRSFIDTGGRRNRQLSAPRRHPRLPPPICGRCCTRQQLSCCRRRRRRSWSSRPLPRPVTGASSPSNRFGRRLTDGASSRETIRHRPPHRLHRRLRRRGRRRSWLNFFTLAKRAGPGGAQL